MVAVGDDRRWAVVGRRTLPTKARERASEIRQNVAAARAADEIGGIHALPEYSFGNPFAIFTVSTVTRTT